MFFRGADSEFAKDKDILGLFQLFVDNVECMDYIEKIITYKVIVDKIYYKFYLQFCKLKTDEICVFC